LKSGTLITTSIAADLGRTVMAVPGRADSRSSAGCLKLIREGAILVRDADDVLEAMSELFPNKVKKDEESCDSKAADPDQPPYTVEEALVMLHVDADGVSLEKIASLTGLGVLKVNSLAMTLRIKGFVRFLPGNRIALSRPVR
jgi:DNA processing protein